MPIVVLPRSLVALFPGTSRRIELDGTTVAEVIASLDQRVPGARNRLCDSGPILRDHINVYVDGSPADLATGVGPQSTVHVIPAVSGGAALDPLGSDSIAD